MYRFQFVNGGKWSFDDESRFGTLLISLLIFILYLDYKDTMKECIRDSGREIVLTEMQPHILFEELPGSHVLLTL